MADYHDFDFDEFYDYEKKCFSVNKEQAKKIRDGYALKRDFWVTDIETNKSLLQAAIDVLHNNVKGNKYKVIYVTSTNGSRLAIFCSPCGKELSSRDPFMSHDNGKNHKKVVQNMLSFDPVPGYMGSPGQGPKVNIEFTPIDKMMEPYRIGTLEDKLSGIRDPVLGLSFLYKEMVHGPDHDYVFSCQLCPVSRISKDQMFNHVAVSQHHNRRYIKLKFNKQVHSLEDYNSICEKIESKEGKVIHGIIDFTQNFIEKSKLGKRAYKGEQIEKLELPSRRSRRSPSPLPPLKDSRSAQTDSRGSRIPPLSHEMLDLMKNGELKDGLDGDTMFGLTACLETLNFKFAQYVMETGVEGPKPPKKKEEQLLTQLGIEEDEYFQGNKNRRRANTEVEDSSTDENMESHKKYNPEKTKNMFQKCINFKKYVDDLNNLLGKKFVVETAKPEPVEGTVKKYGHKIQPPC